MAQARDVRRYSRSRQHLAPPLPSTCQPVDTDLLFPLQAQEEEGQDTAGKGGVGLTIGDCSFPSPAAAYRHILELKQRLLDQRISPAHPDFPFLLGLLERHPRYATKVAPPVAAFIPRRNASRARNLELHFVDSSGREEDFSAIKCLR